MVTDLQNRLFKDTSESNVSLMKEGDRERALLCSAYFVVFIQVQVIWRQLTLVRAEMLGVFYVSSLGKGMLIFFLYLNYLLGYWFSVIYCFFLTVRTS